MGSWRVKTWIDWLTSTYSAQISILPTKSHTWFTVHEFISSLWAWQRRWLVAAVVAVVDELKQVVGMCDWVRDWVTWSVVVAVGDPKLLGLDDSILSRLPTGVDALKSNGDAALVRVSLVDVALVALDDGAVADAPNDWLISDEAFCCNDIYCKAVGIGGSDIRLWGDVVGFEVGDCCWRSVLWLFGSVCFSRFGGAFKICCISASLAARACEPMELYELIDAIYFLTDFPLTSVTNACVLLISINGGNTDDENEMPESREVIKFVVVLGACEWLKRKGFTMAIVAITSVSLTVGGIAEAVGSLFKWSGGEGESLAALIGLILNLESMNRLFELFDLKWIICW